MNFIVCELILSMRRLRNRNRLRFHFYQFLSQIPRLEKHNSLSKSNLMFCNETSSGISLKKSKDTAYNDVARKSSSFTDSITKIFLFTFPASKCAKKHERLGLH